MMAKKVKKARVTLRSLKRELVAARAVIDSLNSRISTANRERVEFFHAVGVVEQTAIEFRGKAQRVADITRTLLGRLEQPPPPMTGMMVVAKV